GSEGEVRHDGGRGGGGSAQGRGGRAGLGGGPGRRVGRRRHHHGGAAVEAAARGGGAAGRRVRADRRVRRGHGVQDRGRQAHPSPGVPGQGGRGPERGRADRGGLGGREEGPVSEDGAAHREAGRAGRRDRRLR